MNKRLILSFTTQAMLATVYVVLVYAFQFLSFEQIQFRIAELLLIFIFFDKKSIIGLTIGTFVANWLFSPFGILDALVGSFATLIGLILMLIFQKHKFVALIFPALSNAFIIGLMISLLDQIPLIPIMLWIFLGEAVVLYALGYPIYKVLKDHPFFIETFHD
ncbi:MAG: QueT transporter family protein [Acholeplasmataceae bacterium]|jgi:uncharacterized membrane protein|nr:QueT transporter family protein [Acholeplasmataceae bacterium]MDY0339357.1 QueT transporter family protein [Acholeplasmataceae bacterium]